MEEFSDEFPPPPTVDVARCPRHGLHGQRDRCYVCDEPVEQVPMVPLMVVEDRERIMREQCESALSLVAGVKTAREFRDLHPLRARHVVQDQPSLNLNTMLRHDLHEVIKSHVPDITDRGARELLDGLLEAIRADKGFPRSIDTFQLHEDWRILFERCEDYWSDVLRESGDKLRDANGEAYRMRKQLATVRELAVDGRRGTRDIVEVLDGGGS